MSDFGITPDGFILKPLQEILNDKAARAREVFGPEIDLRSTSALRKILDISSAADLELWKQAEALYYSGFVSTATGDALDLLGGDLDIKRRQLKARGSVELTLTTGGKNGRTYNIPLGTVVETTALGGNISVRFRTLAGVKLSTQNTKAIVEIEALERGPAGNIAEKLINRINPDSQKAKLSLGQAIVKVENPKPCTGGEVFEADDSYRKLMLGQPRTLWTLEAVRNAVVALDGVRDCRLSDPLGGVDVSQSKFKFFTFGRGRFGKQRNVGTPFFFDILVAIRPGFSWEGLDGVQNAVSRAVKPVRPISVFPNLRLANNVQVGVRAQVLIQPGHDGDAIVASIKDQLENRVNALGLGNSVLYSQVICDIKGVAGVMDVQQLHLRRHPPLMGALAFGRSPRFSGEVIEIPIGANLLLQPDEIAVFQVDSKLIDIEVSST